MTICPVCQSARTLIRVDRRRLARCLQCGAEWVQEGAWQHSITPPSERRLVALIPAPPVEPATAPTLPPVAGQRAAHTP